MTTRILLAGLILLAPVFAQDTEKKEKEEEVEKKRVEALFQFLGDGFGAEKLKSIITKLQSEDAKLRQEAIDELRKLADQPKAISFGIRPSVTIGDRTGSLISGSWNNDDEKGTYTLKAMGEGKYALTAKIQRGGDSQVVKDTGTMGELRKRHKFLASQSAMVAIVPEARTGSVGQFVPGEWPRFIRVQHMKPVVGVRVRKPSDELRHHLEIPVGAGMVVENVQPNSRAAKLGLQKYDLLVRVNGELVENATQLKKLDEEGVTLEYVRRAKSKRLVTPAK